MATGDYPGPSIRRRWTSCGNTSKDVAREPNLLRGRLELPAAPLERAKAGQDEARGEWTAMPEQRATLINLLATA